MAQQQGQRQGQQRYEPVLELEIDSIEFLGYENDNITGRFTITATARTMLGKKRVSDEVIFEAVGLETAPERTDGDSGEFTAAIPVTTRAQTILVKVRTTGQFGKTKTKLQKLPWPEMKSPNDTKLLPDKIDANAVHIAEGHYKINIMVLAEKNQPIKNQLVTVNGEDHRTNEDGTVRPHPEITVLEGEEKKVTIQAGHVIVHLNLSGETKWHKAPPAPDFTDEVRELHGGFFQKILKSATLGIKRAKADIAKEREGKNE